MHSLSENRLKSMGRKLRLMLVDPPVPNASNWYAYPSRGVLYVAGAIRKAFPASDVRVQYQNAFCSLQEHLKPVEEHRPDLDGMSCTTAMAFQACEAMKAVRTGVIGFQDTAVGSVVFVSSLAHGERL